MVSYAQFVPHANKKTFTIAPLLCGRLEVLAAAESLAAHDGARKCGSEISSIA